MQLSLNESTEVKTGIGSSLYTSYKRTDGIEIKAMDQVSSYIDMITEDIYDTFPHATVEQVLGALKQGSMGFYGKTFKFTGQAVCIWIDRFITENPRKKGQEEMEYDSIIREIKHVMSNGYNRVDAIQWHYAKKVCKMEYHDLFDESKDDEMGQVGEEEKVPMRKGDYLNPHREAFRQLETRFWELDKKYNRADEDKLT